MRVPIHHLHKIGSLIREKNIIDDSFHKEFREINPSFPDSFVYDKSTNNGYFLIEKNIRNMNIGVITRKISREYNKKIKAGDWWVCQLNIAANDYRLLFEESDLFFPKRIPPDKPSFGFGDRIGITTCAHINIAKNYPVFPVFAQQSARELERTQRTPSDVMKDAFWDIFEKGFIKGYGADADHLKKEQDIENYIKAGFRMFTIDIIDDINDDVYEMSENQIRDKLSKGCEKDIFQKYKSKGKILLKGKKQDLIMNIQEDELAGTAVKFSSAILKIEKLYHFIYSKIGGDFDLEISVDESNYPTTYLDHYVLVSELYKRNINIFSIAPHFRGQFEKGIDYIGNINEFIEDIDYHNAISNEFEKYKISIHTGSDKFSIYPYISEYTQGSYHVKTAGTSFLEAIKVAGKVDIVLMREILKFCLDRFNEERKSYHLSTNLDNVPKPEDINKENIVEVFNTNNDFRQVIHVGYGPILTEKDNNRKFVFRDILYNILNENYDMYSDCIREHFERHLKALNSSSSGEEMLHK